MNVKLLAVAVLGTMTGFATPVWSDEVPPPPTNCPPGSRGDSDHLGTLCAPTNCQYAAQCKKGEVCREQALCVRTDEHEHHRQRGHKFKRTVVTGVCTPGPKACKAPAVCDKIKRCVAKTVATKATSVPPRSKPTGSKPSGSSSSCAVTVSGGALGARAGWTLFTLAALVIMRRRARPSLSRGPR